MTTRVRVWDLPVRVLHWGLVAAVSLAALSLVDVLGLGAWHRPAGYAALAIVGLRLAWGCIAPGHARVARFVRGPRVTGRYARCLLRGDEPRYLGHNPLGGWMVVALAACVLALGISGWLYTTEWFWGSEPVEDIHRRLAWGLLALVLLHVAGVVFTGLRHRENLVRSMVDGTKRQAGAGDVA